MANAAASSSVQAAVVTASSLPVPPNQGLNLYLYCKFVFHLLNDVYARTVLNGARNKTQPNILFNFDNFSCVVDK